MMPRGAEVMPLMLIDKESFLKKLDRIPDLPTLPVVALKVNKMLMDADVSVKKLSQVIEKDQAMVSKLLRLVNSAFYGFQSRINNISHAVTILGFSTVRNAVVSISVVDAFSGKDAFEGFSMSDFWKHSVAVAVAGRQLAQQSRRMTPDEAFVAGILHDVGKLVLAQHYQELFRDLWITMQDDGMSFYDAEKTLLPVTHATIGGKLAEKWQLPASLVEPIAHHHAIDTAATNLDSTMVVYAADFIVNHYWTGLDRPQGQSDMDPDVAKVLAPELDTVTQWFPAVASEIEEACSFFIEPEGQ